MSLLTTAFISPGGGELLMVMLVLILLFGAKDAPRILRTIQTTLDKLQRAAAEFRYKVMYGDLNQESTPDEPYDVDADYTEDEMDESQPGAQAPEKDSTPNEDSAPPAAGPEAKNTEPKAGD